MTRIAHLTDMHLDGGYERRARLDKAIAHAAQLGSQHLLLTGDLTESGSLREFEDIADALHGWPTNAVTIVPGNHDGHPARWREALNGPLQEFRLTSTPGMVTDVGDAVIVPVSTQIGSRAPLFWALGHVSAAQVRMLHAAADATAVRRKAMIVAMHHGPQLNLLQPLDGLTNRHAIGALVKKHPHVWLCCGHDHRALDLGHVFVAASVAGHDDPLRVYDVRGPQLAPVYKSGKSGSYFDWLGL